MINLKELLSRRPGFWFFQISGWTVFAILMKVYYREREIDSFITFFRFFLTYFLGFLLSIGLRYYYKWILKKGRSIIFILFNIILASLVFHIVWEPLDIFISSPFLTPEQLNDYLEYFKPLNLKEYYKSSIFWFFIPVTWSVLYIGLKFWIDLIESKERGEKYLLLSQRTQLQMLRYQLNPHFLFNSLSSIQALVYDDPAHADIMITQLSDFLRYTIRDKDKLFITLKEEVIIVEKYLSIEKTRFPDRLNYRINVSPEASEQEVLAFILQPFVENAVKYGMKSSPDSLNILINGYCKGGALILEVINNGIWIESQNEGTGIKNVFERLENAYPGKYKLDIGSTGGVVEVKIEIMINQ